MKTISSFVFLFLLQLTALAQTENWEVALNQSLNDFKNCMSSEDKGVCQTYTARAIRQIYNIDDYYSTSSQEDMSPFEIQEVITHSSDWIKLGEVYQHETISKAQELCNAGKPVLVVLKGKNPTDVHVSLMLPGELQPSGTWGMHVPSVASFFTHNPENSFVNKSISYAYTKNMMLHLEVYTRN